MKKGADGPGTGTRVAEFAAILAPTDGSDMPVVVGGHAVNLWSQHFFVNGLTELAEFIPFVSKDLDLIGSGDLLYRLHVSLKGKLRQSEPRSPVVGRVECPGPRGSSWIIEVLHTVHGLSPKDLRRTVDVEVDGVIARTLLPHLVLKAKLANAATLAQEGRQDVKHARMMILCVRAFLEESLAGVRHGALGERAVVNLLGEILEIIRSGPAVQAGVRWGLDLSAVWPLEALRDRANPKVARWAEHRFPGTSGETG